MPRDGSRNRERILDVAERLVIDNGFSATPIDAVIAGAQTSKGAFFNHFATKNDLAEALVERYVDADLAHLAGALTDVATIADPVARVVAFVRIFESEADQLMGAQSSCLYVAVLSERQLVRSVTAAAIRRAVIDWRVALAEMLREAHHERGGLSDIDTDDLADHLFVTFEGAFVLCRSLDDPGYMRRQLTVVRQIIERLLA